jgi:hypothetical protein
MADSSDDSTPPKRRSSGSAPPFIAPRGKDAAPVEPPRAMRRSSTPLFVPPLPPEEEAAPEFVPPVDASPPAPEAPRTPTPPISSSSVTPPSTTAAARESRAIEYENLETPEIELRITGERPAIGETELQVIAYDDANSELQANAPHGEMPRVDGIELESTELSLEPTSKNPKHAPSDLNIESFWAADAFTPTVKPAAEPAPDDAPTRRRSTLDSLRVEEVMPPNMPTPPSVSAITPRVPRPSVPVPTVRSPTPVDVRTPAALEALKELEPWPQSSAAPADSTRMVADALERVARRIRSGELRVPADAAGATEENALSAALQALVRAPRR